jgi:hypothetical protein
MNSTKYPALNWQPETLAAIARLQEIAPGTVSARDMVSGLALAEPYLVILDQCIRIAKAYRTEFERPISEDYMASPEIASILSGVRAFLNFDGAAKWEIPTMKHDTKDNGTLESLYWTACEIAGLDGENL